MITKRRKQRGKRPCCPKREAWEEHGIQANWFQGHCWQQTWRKSYKKTEQKKEKEEYIKNAD